MSKEASQEFLDKMIHSRIGIRVIAEHFLALQSPGDHWIGVVNTQTSPAKLVSSICNYVAEVCEFNYGVAPCFDINGHVNTQIAYITVHLEYILMELLKNAMRATVEQAQRMNIDDSKIPSLEISISESNQDVIIRIRDRGGGIHPNDLSKVWEYSWTSVPQYDEDDSTFTTQAKLSVQRGTGGPMVILLIEMNIEMKLGWIRIWITHVTSVC